MSIVPLPHADVAIDADYYCELVHWENGRCAREGGRAEDHHVDKRSEGGSDEPENRALACPTHHRAVHHQGSRRTGEDEHDRELVGWMFRIVMPNGDHAYAEELASPGPRRSSKKAVSDAMVEFDDLILDLDLDGEFEAWELLLGPFLRERGFDLWLLWSNVSARWEASAASAHSEILRAVELQSGLCWVEAGGMFELFVGQKWTLLGLEIHHDPRDPFKALEQYAPHAGVSYRVAKDRLRTESRRRRLPPVEAERARSLPYRLMRDGGKRLVRMTSEERDRVFTEAEVGTASSALDELRQIVAESYREEETETRLVVGEATLKIRAEVEVDSETHLTEEDLAPIDHVRKRLGQHKYVESVLVNLKMVIDGEG